MNKKYLTDTTASATNANQSEPATMTIKSQTKNPNKCANDFCIGHPMNVNEIELTKLQIKKLNELENLYFTIKAAPTSNSLMLHRFFDLLESDSLLASHYFYYIQFWHDDHERKFATEIFNDENKIIRFPLACDDFNQREWALFYCALDIVKNYNPADHKIERVETFAKILTDDAQIGLAVIQFACMNRLTVQSAIQSAALNSTPQDTIDDFEID